MTPALTGNGKTLCLPRPILSRALFSPELLHPKTAGWSTHNTLTDMVRSTIIVRASDTLPLAASVDDEQVSLVHLFNSRPFLNAYTCHICVIDRASASGA